MIDRKSLIAGSVLMGTALQIAPLSVDLDGVSLGAKAAYAKGGNGGGFRPMCTYMTDTGTFCRDFEETLRVDSREDSYRNVACRRKTGGWVWVGS